MHYHIRPPLRYFTKVKTLEASKFKVKSDETQTHINTPLHFVMHTGLNFVYAACFIHQ